MPSKPNLPILLGSALLLGLLAGACSCGEPPTKGQQPELRPGLGADPTGRADYLLSFGDVTVGARQVEPIEMKNAGSTPLTLEASEVAEPFGIEGMDEPLTIGVGATAQMVFAFAPVEATESPIETVVTLESNEEKRPKRTVRLSGRGVPPRLACTPSPIDFGKVARDTSRTLTTICTNSLDIPLILSNLQFKGSSGESFSARVLRAEEGGTPIPAGETVSIEITFRASLTGLNEGVLQMRDPNDQLLGAIPVFGDVVLSSLRIDPASCLDFGYVELGASLRKELTLENVGTEDVQVLGFKLEAGEYTVHAEAPIRISRGVARAVEVEFAPTTGGRKTTSLEIATDQATVSACITGFGGGPKLICTPGSIDFGAVAIGAPVKRRLSCRNGGFVPPGESADPLVIHSLETDNPVFQAVILNPDGSPGVADPKGYAIGEGFDVLVSHAPVATGFDSGNAIFRTNTAVDHLVPLAGNGVDLPPCVFSITPPQLRFGIVERGAEKTQLFGIENHLATACLISDLKLSDDSDPAFSLTAIGSQVLDGGETLAVPVRFAPTEYGDYTGRVTFQISDPEAGEQSVSLRGRSAQACIVVEPDPLDFGKTAPDCDSRDQIVMIANVCGVPLTVTDVGIDQTLNTRHFAMRSLPELPLTLEPHQRTEATLRFRPKTLGELEGTLYVEVDSGGAERDVYLSGLLGEGSLQGEQTDRFIQQERPKVDVLWVIDNSGSMSVFQEAVSKRLPQFLSYALAQDIDFQLGVTTTSLTLFPTNMCCPGGAGCVERGRLFPVDSRGMDPPWPRILTPRTPNIEDVWRYNTRVGTCSGAEMPLEAALQALSPPLINSDKDPRPNKIGHPTWLDGNIGFLREDAALSIIMMTDEMDHSDHGLAPLGYLDAYRNLKGPRFRQSVKVSAITVPHSRDPVPTCGWFMDRGDRILDVVEASGGESFNLCTPPTNVEAWDAALEKMSKGAFGISLRYILRGKAGPRSGNGPVTEADLEVYVDGNRVLPRSGNNVVWTYDPVGNAVDFAPLFLPKPGSNISINYRVACVVD